MFEFRDGVGGIVNEIKRLHPNLTVQYCDPDSLAAVGDPPYRIVERRDGQERVVLAVYELDQRVLDKLLIMDHFKNPHILEDIQKTNDAVKQASQAKFSEAVREQALIAHTANNSKKISYSFRTQDGKLKAYKKDLPEVIEV